MQSMRRKRRASTPAGTLITRALPRLPLRRLPAPTHPCFPSTPHCDKQQRLLQPQHNPQTHPFARLQVLASSSRSSSRSSRSSRSTATNPLPRVASDPYLRCWKRVPLASRTWTNPWMATLGRLPRTAATLASANTSTNSMHTSSISSSGSMAVKQKKSNKNKATKRRRKTKGSKGLCSLATA